MPGTNHRTRPALVSFLSLAALAFALSGVADALAQGDNLPSGESLMDGYLKATGGKEAYEKVKTYVAKGTLTVAGMKGDAVIHGKAPSFMHFAVTLPGIGTMEMGYDGKVLWENNPITGAKLSDSSQQKDLVPGLDFGSEADWRKNYKSAKTMALEKYNGKDVYRVLLTDKSDKTEDRYFEKDSGLVVRMKKSAKTELGNFVVDADIGEYKKVGDIVIAHKTSAAVLGQKMEFRLDSVQLNVEVPESKFALPEAVKELLKKKEMK